MKLAINGQQLSATHSLPQILDMFDDLGVKAIEIWPFNLETRVKNGGESDQSERYGTRDVAGAAALLKSRGFTCPCVLCAISKTMVRMAG